VDSSPPGAAVTLDGRPLGQTPVDVTVDAMQTDATVVVELAGYVPEARELSLSRDALVEIALTQAAAPPGKPRRPLRKAVRANARPAGRDGRNPPQDGLGIKEDR
jgi:hypothetical protein